MNCAERKQFFLENILRDIEAHECGRFHAIGAWQKTLPRWEKCENLDEESRHLAALEFCDCWCDAANHQWYHYDGVEERDWPIIARQIYRGLDESWPPDETRNNFVFDPPPKPPKVPLCSV